MSGKPKTAKRTESAPADVAPPSRDVALIRGRTPDGEGLSVIRKQGDKIELGTVKPLKEGVPISGEVVTLRPRPEFPLLCDVDVAYAPPSEATSDVKQRSQTPQRGPAQVATQRYRENWDAIWRRRPSKRELAN